MTLGKLCASNAQKDNSKINQVEHFAHHALLEKRAELIQVESTATIVQLDGYNRILEQQTVLNVRLVNIKMKLAKPSAPHVFRVGFRMNLVLSFARVVLLGKSVVVGKKMDAQTVWQVTILMIIISNASLA